MKAPKTPRVTVRLRPLEAAEVDAVADIWHEGWRDGHLDIVPAELIQFRDRATFRARLQVSLDDCFVTGPVGAPTGFVRLHEDEVDQFYVSADARGTGLAGVLMQAVEGLLRGRGIARAWLYCSVGNARAARFYSKAGWMHATTVEAAVETLSDPVMMLVMRFEKDL